MSQRLSDYFALEAGDYLDELDRLLARGGTPDAERFFRLARGVRGSAQLAQAERIARVAALLEGAAEALRAGRLRWDAEAQARAVATVDELRTLVRAVDHWGPEAERLADAAAARWGESAPTAAPRPEPAGEERLLGFLSAELRRVAGTLERATTELDGAPAQMEPLRQVLRSMRAVLGVRATDALQPLLRLLEEVEDAVRALLAAAATMGEEERALLLAGAAALARTGVVLEERRAAPAELPEWQRFRELRDELAPAAAGGGAAGAVPVRLFFHDDGGPHLVAATVAPLPAPDGQGPGAEALEFVRLKTVGLLDRADALAVELADPAATTAAAPQLAELVQAAADLAATYGVADLAAAADAAAEQLRPVRTAAEARALLAGLRRQVISPAAPEIPPPTPPPPAPAQAPMESPEAEAEGEAEALPIEALLLRGEPALREALALRPRLEEALAAAAPAPEALGALLGELFDLVALGLGDPRPGSAGSHAG